MSKLSIITVPNHILRQKAKKINPRDPFLRKIIPQMIDILRQEKGVGLAAPQVGISLRVIVIESQQKNTKIKIPSIPLMVLINPEIIKYSQKITKAEEGCLSIPNIWGVVERPHKVIVKAYNQENKLIKIKATGFLARVIQHEIDHLNGVLFTDKVDLNTLHKITPDGQKIKINPLFL